jgi:DNA-binding NtrC family response regulator
LCYTAHVAAGDETVNQTWARRSGPQREPALPGLLLVHSGTSPQLTVFPVGDGVELGRGGGGGTGGGTGGTGARIDIDDSCMSRKHATVHKSATGAGWLVTDLDSRNGSALDGVAVTGAQLAPSPRVLRVGDTLLLFQDDVRPLLAERAPLIDGGIVIGPTLARALRVVDAAAAGSDVLHVTGETGAGKEFFARRFHLAGARKGGPFVSVNCATIPDNLAERLFFGAKKGAYSGADKDVDGYLQAADGGTLFLDEVAELDAKVQAKLLRVLETREVTMLGATTSKKLSLSIVSATHSGLRALVEAGKFRQDLFFRLGRPSVALPALRERREDIPWIIAGALGPDRAHVSLVEAALLREWPGNVRELLLEVREAARQADVAGAARVESVHLSAEAGTRATPVLNVDTAATTAATATTTTATAAAATAASATAAAATAAAAASTAAASAGSAGAAKQRGANVEVPPKEDIERALAAADGNISQAARALGAHRTQLRRWMERYGLIVAGDV